jgi:predicted regulator of Ras-like GTPase activity (Roadblock/LC7/MglB family)
MAMLGSLKDMSVADIIQHNCQDRKTAYVEIKRNNTTARLYFHDGAVVHASMAGVTGEEVIYQILPWDDGEFSLEMDIEAPVVTIKRGWSGLLLEGAKRLDEQTQKEEDLLGEIPAADNKASLVQAQLKDFLGANPDIKGIVVTGMDGYIRHCILPDSFDKGITGSVCAAAFNFGRRSENAIFKDQFTQAVITGETSSIIVTVINKYSLLAAVLNEKPVDLTLVTHQLNELSGVLSRMI